LVLGLLEKSYSISIGSESDFYFSAEYLFDLENVYEFFFIRHFENLVNYFVFMIKKMKSQIITSFTPSLREAEGDIFLAQLRGKLKNDDDVLIIHFFRGNS
jgi:hypothetical protein